MIKVCGLSRLTRYVGMVCCTTLGLAAAQAQGMLESKTAAQVIERCTYPEAIGTRRGELTMTVTNKGGKVTKERRFGVLLKRYPDGTRIAEKLALFTLAPPDFRGNGYLRWRYPASSGKAPEQWVYSAKLQKRRRLSPRYPGDLSWGLIGEDLAWSASMLGSHKLLDASGGSGNIAAAPGQMTYRLESRPVARDSHYGKVIRWFRRHGEDGQCEPWYVDFYDREGRLVKRVTVTWAQYDGVWLRDRITVLNLTLGNRAAGVTTEYVFESSEWGVEVSESQVSKRALSRGWR